MPYILGGTWESRGKVKIVTHGGCIFSNDPVRLTFIWTVFISVTLKKRMPYKNNGTEVQE